MVKIALAGASSNVASELLDVLLATQKHEILLLLRKSNPNNASTSKVTWSQTAYNNFDELANALKDVHTVLCFITPQSDPNNTSQKLLIDAAVQAGVKRYAPSEWASSTFNHMPWYANKASIRQYLLDLNHPVKKLQYSLFQPGMFLDYLAHP